METTVVTSPMNLLNGIAESATRYCNSFSRTGAILFPGQGTALGEFRTPSPQPSTGLGT